MVLLRESYMDLWQEVTFKVTEPAELRFELLPKLPH